MMMATKPYIILILLMGINFCHSQDTFVRKYTSYLTKTNDKLSDWEEIDLTVVFNEKITNNVVLYYPTKTKTLYKIGNIKTNTTTGGHQYQVIDCIDEEGNKLSLQLFSSAMRIILHDGDGYIEFHE